MFSGHSVHFQVSTALASSYMAGRHSNLTCSCVASDKAERQDPWAYCCFDLLNPATALPHGFSYIVFLCACVYHSVCKIYKNIQPIKFAFGGLHCDPGWNHSILKTRGSWTSTSCLTTVVSY